MEKTNMNIQRLNESQLERKAIVGRPMELPNREHLLYSLASVVGSDIVSGMLKCTYSLLGNLPKGLQQRLEKTVGRQNYCADNAEGVSAITNIFGYSLIGGITAGVSAFKDKFSIGETAFYSILAGSLGLGIGLVEFVLRDDVLTASIPGYILSVPIYAALGVTKGVRNYAKSVTFRTQERMKRLEEIEYDKQ